MAEPITDTMSITNIRMVNRVSHLFERLAADGTDRDRAGNRMLLRLA
jgi:hypothetical protein